MRDKVNRDNIQGDFFNWRKWASGSDGQEPDIERTTALITGEVLFCTG